MKKLFAILIFILSFSARAFAQEPKPITLDPETATETTITATEVRLSRLTIDIASNGSFNNSRITVVAMIGIPSMSIDPISGLTLFTKVSEQEIFSGTLAAYTEELQTAVNNNVITNEQKTAIMAGLIDIYKKSFEGFVTTSNILQANGKLQLRAKKVSQ